MGALGQYCEPDTQVIRTSGAHNMLNRRRTSLCATVNLRNNHLAPIWPRITTESPSGIRTLVSGALETEWNQKRKRKNAPPPDTFFIPVVGVVCAITTRVLYLLGLQIESDVCVLLVTQIAQVLFAEVLSWVGFARAGQA